MRKTVQTAPRERLLSIDNIWALAQRLKTLNLSRREVVAVITAILYAHLEAGGVILTGEGEPLHIYPGIVDDVHGEDGSACWISEQRKRGYPRRRPRRTLLQRLQIYDATFLLAGQPILPEARAHEVKMMRELMRGFSPVARARYIHAARALRARLAGERNGLVYGFELRQLRLRIAAESAHWQANR